MLLLLSAVQRRGELDRNNIHIASPVYLLFISF